MWRGAMQADAIFHRRALQWTSHRFLSPDHRLHRFFTTTGPAVSGASLWMSKLWTVTTSRGGDLSGPQAAPSTADPAPAPDVDMADLPAAETAVQTYLTPGVLPADDLPRAIAAARRVPASGAAPTLGILHLVKLLGPSMTDASNAPRRSRAIQLLSQVVCRAAEDKANTELSRQATRTLTGFFASTLDDASGLALSAAPPSGPAHAPDKRWPTIAVPPGSEMLASSLAALTALVQVHSFGLEATQSICDSLFGSAPHGPEEATQDADAVAQGLGGVIQRLTQGMRMMVYLLVDKLVADRRDTLRRPKLLWQFLSGYVNVVRGEKDPRNLNILFPLDRFVLLEYGRELSSTAQANNAALPSGSGEPALSPAQARSALEGLFDVSFCYFPITFRAPPGGAGPSASTLRIKLRQVLSSHPGMAPLALPVMLEKLSATGGRSRRDTLRTLTAALPVYGPGESGKSASSLWKALRPELIHPSAGEADSPAWSNTQIAAQDTLIALLRTLYPDPPTDDKNILPPEGLAPTIATDMLELLESTSSPFSSLEEAQYAPSVLACLVRATARTSHFALYAGTEALLKPFAGDADSTPDARAGALRGLATLLAGMSDSYAGRSSALASAAARGSITPSAEDDEVDEMSHLPDFSGGRVRSYETDDCPLDRFRPTLLAALHAGVAPASTGGVSETDASSRTAGLAAAVAAIRVPGLLSQDEVQLLVQAMCDALLPVQGGRPTPTPDAEARGQLSASLAAVARASELGAAVVGSFVVPCIEANLPSAGLVASGEHVAEHRAAVRHGLGSLTQLVSQACVPAITRQAQELLACRLPAAIQTTRECGVSAVGYARALISALHLLASLPSPPSEDKAAGARDLLVTLLDVFAGVGKPQPVEWDVLVADAAALATVLARATPTPVQAALPSGLRKALASSDLTDVNTHLPGAWVAAHHADADESASQSLLLVSILAGLPARFESDAEASRWIAQMALQFLQAGETLSARAASLAVADALNKAPFRSTPPALETVLQHVFYSTVGVAPAPEGNVQLALAELGVPAPDLQPRGAPPPETMTAGLHAYLLVVQALAARLAPEAWSMLTALLERGATAPPPLALSIVAGLTRVAEGSPGVFAPANGHTVRKLARQRTAAALLPAIADGYRRTAGGGEGTAQPGHTENTEEQQGFYLSALAAVLPRVPSSARSSSLAQVWPMLVRALQAEQPGTAASAAKAMTGALVAAKLSREEAREREILARTQAIRTTGSDALAESTEERDAIALAQDHIGSLLSSHLRALDAREESDRLAALWALRALALALPTVAIWPRRNEVQRCLSATGRGVDDPRRIVRTAAVEARDAWLSLRQT